MRLARLDVLDEERRVQNAKGEEGAEMLRRQHRVEAHHRDARCDHSNDRGSGG